MSSVLSLPLSSLPPTAPAPDPSLQQGGDAGGGPIAGDPGPFSAMSAGVGRLQRNPQLPQHPLGAYTDSMYEAQLAQLKMEISQRYNDVLQQLGYTDDNGNFVPGQVEIEANRNRSELGRNLQLADEQTTQQAQQQGTLFSGLRGTAQARAEYPFANALGQLGVDVPKKLSDLYGQAGGLVNEFTIRHNLMLADAAQRAAANLQNNAAAGGNVTGAPGSAPVGGGLPAEPVPTGATFGTGGVGFGEPGVVGLEGQRALSAYSSPPPGSYPIEPRPMPGLAQPAMV